MKPKQFLDGRVSLYHGDCLEVLAQLPENSVDSVVCDPPYHLTSIVKRFGAENAAPAKSGKTGAFARASAGFMGKQWDGGDIAFRVETWEAVLRVLKPGGHLVAFSGTRTYHRMVCAIEDAGFEVRDQIGWAYGSGFPKSHNAGDGWGTALKPAWEPICLARKPLIGTVAANVLKHGTGALNIDATRVPFADGNDLAAAAAAAMRASADQNAGRKVYGNFENGPASIAPYLANMQKGRWPANLVHDGSEEVIAAFPTEAGAFAPIRGSEPSVPAKGDVAYGFRDRVGAHHGDTGSAARFFYTAKADAEDRIGSKHPTIKPVSLLRWLSRLVTPKGGLILDPFSGTGTTGEAAFIEGFRSVLVEREAEYVSDIERRMDLVLNPSKRVALAKCKNALTQDFSDLPLFGA